VGRSFRFNDAKGKTVDDVEFYTVHGYHCVDMAFADKTALLVKNSNQQSAGVLAFSI
jgi:hypothetical protein